MSYLRTSGVPQDSILKTSELLRKAAGEIRRRGWWQGFYRELDAVTDRPVGSSEDCKVCAWGALNVALGGEPQWPGDGDEFTQSRVALRYLRGATGMDAAAFNDTPGRTVEEVLEAFEVAAVAAEAEGD